MAETTDQARLELKSNAEQFAAEIAQSENALSRLQAQLKLSPQNFAALDAAMDAEVDKLEVLRRDLAQTEAALARLDAAGGKAANKLKGLGQAGLQTGRVIQDFAQGGIAGVLNNIEGFTQAIGGGPGMAGVLTGLGVALYLLKPAIAGFIESLNPERPREFTDAVDDLKTKIKELTDKPVRLTVETIDLKNAKERLNELEDARKAFEAVGKGKTAFEREAGEAFKEAFDELGQRGETVKWAIVDQLAGQKNATNPDIAAAQKIQDEASGEIARAAKMHGLDPANLSEASPEFQSLPMATQGGIRNARARQRKAADRIEAAKRANRQAAADEVGQMFQGVLEGNNAEARKGLAGAFRGVGEDQLAGLVENTSPEAMQQFDEIEAAFDNSVERVKARFDRFREKEKKAKAENSKIVDALNKQGKEGEAEALRENRKMLADRGKQKKEAANARDKGVKAADKSLDEAESSLKDTTLDEQAAEFLARMQAQGGLTDRNGRFRRLGPEQQLAALRSEIARQVQAAFPGLDKMQAGSLTERFTAGARDQVEEQTAQARRGIMEQARAAGVSLTGQQATNLALQEALGLLQMVLVKQRQEEAKTRQFGQAFGRMQRMFEPAGQTNLNFGMQ